MKTGLESLDTGASKITYSGNEGPKSPQETQQKMAEFELQEYMEEFERVFPDMKKLRGTQEYMDNLGFPGQHPYTRGIHPNLYRGKLWTMRQFSGFSSPDDTNKRFKYLLEQGQTGLSVAYDMPTLMGYDADHLLSEGEVGKVGVPISFLSDMESLLKNIPLYKV